MPDIAVRDLRQPTVYWERTSFDVNGNGVYKDPIQIKTRWEKHVSTNLDPEKGPIAFTFTVFVDREIKNGSKVWKGCLKDLPATYDLRKYPTTRDYDECPDIDGKLPQRTVIAS